MYMYTCVHAYVLIAYKHICRHIFTYRYTFPHMCKNTRLEIFVFFFAPYPFMLDIVWLLVSSVGEAASCRWDQLCIMEATDRHTTDKWNTQEHTKNKQRAGQIPHLQPSTSRLRANVFFFWLLCFHTASPQQEHAQVVWGNPTKND